MSRIGLRHIQSALLLGHKGSRITNHCAQAVSPVHEPVTGVCSGHRALCRSGGRGKTFFGYRYGTVGIRLIPDSDILLFPEQGIISGSHIQPAHLFRYQGGIRSGRRRLICFQPPDELIAGIGNRGTALSNARCGSKHFVGTAHRTAGKRNIIHSDSCIFLKIGSVFRRHVQSVLSGRNQRQ